MNTSTRLRRFGICVSLIATLGLATCGGGAEAQAVPSTYNPPPTTETVPDTDLCTGLSGITTGTTTENWRFVDGADGTTHVHLTLTLDYRSDWSNGTYLISHSISHNEFQASPDQTVREFSFTQQDRGTLYSADGQVIGYRNVFTCSMADLFGRWVPVEWIEAVLDSVRANPMLPRLRGLGRHAAIDDATAGEV